MLEHLRGMEAFLAAYKPSLLVWSTVAYQRRRAET